MANIQNFIVLTLLIASNVNGQNNTDCNEETCPPNDCYCPTINVPDDLDPGNIPQLVIMSFNGPMTYKHREYIEEIFKRRRKNPNGTPIRMTLFVSDDDEITDYCSVNRLWSATNEIASFSASRKTPQSFWAGASEDEWETEIDGQKETLIEEAMIPETEITGFRSPFLQTGGNAQYKFAVDKGYVFDSSIVIPKKYSEEMQPNIWPYTMDFPSGLDCYTAPCPDGKFPGFWQIPVQPLFDTSNRPCIYLDSCPSPPKSSEEVYNILMENFNHSYHNNRAPFMVNFLNYKKWFDENKDWPIAGINRFIDELLAFESDDVYFVSYSDLIGWMKTPTDLRLIRYFPAFARIQKEANECDEQIDPRPYLNGVALVVIESVLLISTYIYFYVKEKQE